MEQRTCNLILCCKGHCKIGTGEQLGPAEAIAAYMSKECGCPAEDYKGTLLYSILKTAVIDFFRSSDNPGFHLSQLLEDNPLREVSLTDRIITLFSLAEVKTKDEDGTWRYVNGFTDELIGKGEEFLEETANASA